MSSALAQLGFGQDIDDCLIKLRPTNTSGNKRAPGLGLSKISPTWKCRRERNEPTCDPDFRSRLRAPGRNDHIGEHDSERESVSSAPCCHIWWSRGLSGRFHSTGDSRPQPDQFGSGVYE